MYKYLPTFIGAMLISSSSVLAEPFAAQSIESLIQQPTLNQNMNKSIMRASEHDDAICAKNYLAHLQRKQQHLKQLLLQHTLTIGSTMQVLTMKQTQSSGMETLSNTTSTAIARPTCLQPHPS